LKNPIKTPIDIQTLIQIHDGAIDYFTKLWKRGIENERYYSADPFTDEQKREYALQDRIPFSISSIPQKLNSIISIERNSRVSLKAKVIIDPDDISDDPQQQQQLFQKEVKANLATLRLKMIESLNSAEYKYSDIFASGVAMIYGAAKIYTDTNRNGEDTIKLKDIDYQNLLWDVNSVEYEHNDAQWMAEKRYMYRIDVERLYGKQAAQNLSIGDAAMRWGRKKHQYYVNYNKNGNSDLDLLTVLEHYHKELRIYHAVLFGGTIVSMERKKEDAEKTLRMLQIPYFKSGQDLPPADIIEVPRLMLDKYMFTYTDVLEYEETDMELFPYSIYQAFQFKSKIWTMTDILKSMQQLANRLLAQIDYAFGVDIKNVYEIVLPALEGTGLTPEEAIRMVKEEGYIPVMQPGALVPVKSQGMNPQWAQIMNTMLTMIDEIGGGKAFSGTMSASHTSAKAVNALVMQGQLLTSAFIDNRNRFLQDLGNKTMWFMKKYDNSPYVMKVEGGALTPEMLQLLQQDQMYSQSQENPQSGYLKVNQNGKNYLDDSNFELEIIEESVSDSKREIEFSEMSQMEQADQDLLLSPTWRKKKIEKIRSITYEDRERVIQEIEQAKQQQQQQAQAQQQFAQQQMQDKSNMDKAKILLNDKEGMIRH